MNLSTYLYEQLSLRGVEIVFGIPGDFALPLFAALEESPLRTVVPTHEPSAGYAADAYARLRGLGVAMTTWGAGGLNVVNPISQAYAERSPVLVISGAPEGWMREQDLMVHHRVRDFDSQLRIFEEVTCAAERLDDPSTARAKIDAVLARIALEQRPGYLEIPRDMVGAEIGAPPTEPSAAPIGPVGPMPADPLAGAVEAVISQLSKARSPVVVAGVEVVRYGLRPALEELARSWDLPVLTTMLGKGALREDHPHFKGTCMGLIGPDATVELLQGADLVLTLGVLPTDVNSGLYTLPFEELPQIVGTSVGMRIDGNDYAVPLSRLLPALAKAAPSLDGAGRSALAAPTTPLTLPDTLNVDDVLTTLSDAIVGHPTLLTIDVGDALFSVGSLRANEVLAPSYYASMGFAVPAALAAQLARPDLKPIAVVGDGAFQMTGMELAIAPREGLSPLVLVLDNSGYETLRALDGERRCYEVSAWDYVALARSFGVDGARIESAGELRELMSAQIGHDRPFLAHVMLDGRPSRTLRRMREVTRSKAAQ